MNGMLISRIMKMKGQNVETLILEIPNTCSDFPMKINSRKLQLIRENPYGCYAYWQMAIKY